MWVWRVFTRYLTCSRERVDHSLGSPFFSLGVLGDFPGAVAEGCDHVEVAAEGGDVGADDVDAGDLTVLDFGDAGLGDAKGVGELSLGDAGGCADFGELVASEVGLAAFGGLG